MIGLQGMLNVFKATKMAKDATAAGQLLSEQGLRLTSSDVVWDDFFRKPARTRAGGHDGRRRRRPRFQVRRECRALQRPLDERDLAAHPRCLDGRHATAPRLEPRVRPRTAERPDASLTTETTIQVSTDLGFEVGSPIPVTSRRSRSR